MNNTKEKNRKKQATQKRRILILAVVIITAVFLQFKFDAAQKMIRFFYPVFIESIEISTDKTELLLNESVQLTYIISPEDYSKSNLLWYCSDKEIAEISAEGVLTARNSGKVTVYLTDIANEKNEVKSNEIEIQCSVLPEKAVIENEIKELRLGNTYDLQVKVLPENATYKDVFFERSDSAIISVDENGRLTANKIGIASVIIKSYSGKELKRADIEVTKIPVESIKMDESSVTLGKGQSYILNASVLPLSATYTDIIWESADKNIVTISSRRIKAVGTGSTEIRAVTDEGDKIAVCKITVKQTIPNNPVKYAKSKYSIKNGAGKSYSNIASINKFEAVEFLTDLGNGWRKVRNSDGIVGYSQISKENCYDTLPPENQRYPDSYMIKNVPYINQFSLGYPTGCEDVSATMLLQYYGYKVTCQSMIDNTKMGSKKYQGADGKWYGANPFEEFVGHPTGRQKDGNYGVFAKPIAQAMRVYAGSRVKNISGCSENDLFKNVSLGRPVLVWCTNGGKNLIDGVDWYYPDGSGKFHELVGQHCAVLIGYDENYVYLNDPAAGRNARQSKTQFIKIWKQLYSQAIIIE